MPPPSETDHAASSAHARGNGKMKESGDDIRGKESKEPDQDGERNDTHAELEQDDRQPTNANSDTNPNADPNNPPLPNEALPPPLPNEPLPDDGWQPIWDDTNQAFYFFNRFTGVTQWTNPRVPDPDAAAAAAPTGAPGTGGAPGTTSARGEIDVSQPPPGVGEQSPPERRRPAGGYDPSIHGDYDPNAWYAQPAQPDPSDEAAALNPLNPLDPSSSSASAAADYSATGAFNRFTGRWQAADQTPDKFSDENKSKRQMNAFFDVDAAANSHDGRSLKAERAGKKLSKQELKQFKEKRKARKEEKRRAWLRD